MGHSCLDEVRWLQCPEHRYQLATSGVVSMRKIGGGVGFTGELGKERPVQKWRQLADAKTCEELFIDNVFVFV